MPQITDDNVPKTYGPTLSFFDADYPKLGKVIRNCVIMMSVCFICFSLSVQDKQRYIIIWQILQEIGKVVEEVYTRLDGCPIMNNVCVDCLTVKNQLGLLTGDDEVGFGGLFSYIFSVHILPNDFSIPVIIYGVPWSTILVFSIHTCLQITP